MDVEPGAGPSTTSSTIAASGANLAALLQDSENWLPRMTALRETDVIILLTPVVPPTTQESTDISDPFEPLGRALARRHARIRHVPYTMKNGITSTHVAFIKRGHVIILCFAVQPGQPIPLELAAVVFAVGDNKPCIIVVCSSPADIQETIPFPTVIQTTGYTPPALEATADLIFGEHVPGIGRQPGLATGSAPQSRRWMVEQWNEARDMADVLNLWTENVSSRFSLDHQTFAFLLRRPGYAKHYVVRYPRSDEILGFCATYLSYADREGENLIASLAILLVRRQSRNQGVGLSLHNHAIDQLRRTRGVIRVQLGSTFPRILYGPPVAMQMDEEWFQRRGWQLNMDVPGQGRAVHDVILDFVDWQHVPATASSSSSMRFRLCVQEDMDRVLALVDETSTRLARMGWFDQYSSLMNGPNVKDIVIGLGNNVIVAAALTYTPSCGSQIASNLPWAGRAGDDVGGVACICISSPRDGATVVGLLDACVQNLQTQGMRSMFLDGVGPELEDLKRLGFKEWAAYKDVWKDV